MWPASGTMLDRDFRAWLRFFESFTSLPDLCPNFGALPAMWPASGTVLDRDFRAWLRFFESFTNLHDSMYASWKERNSHTFYKIFKNVRQIPGTVTLDARLAGVPFEETLKFNQIFQNIAELASIVTEYLKQLRYTHVHEAYPSRRD